MGRRRDARAAAPAGRQMPTPTTSDRRRALRRFSRRRLLGALGGASAGLLLAACGGGEEEPGVTVDVGDDAEPTAPAAAEETASAAATAEAADAGSGSETAGASPGLETEPLIWVEPREVLQGTAFIVAIDAPGAGFASLAFGGQILSMHREGPRFYAILGIDALAPVGPVPLIISVADGAGDPAVHRETFIEVQDAEWQTEVVQLDEENRSLLDPGVIRQDAETRAPFLRSRSADRFWHDIFDPPAAGVITSGYGLLRSYNFRPPSEYHAGVDFAGASGDTIVAPSSGVVLWGGQTQRRGNGLIVDHGAGVTSGYYHLSDFAVAPGQVVQPGQFLGRMGATGLATGPHLHWEIVVHGITVNPVQWIRALGFPSPSQEFDPLDALPARLAIPG
jgi:murein DD-endopeptidase MepM/ murein hydrolase activator NlpD